MTPIPLTQLEVGLPGRIERVGLDGEFSARLRALGLSPGQTIDVMRQAPWHGPLHLRIGTTEFMLRTEQARHIWVTPTRD